MAKICHVLLQMTSTLLAKRKREDEYVKLSNLDSLQYKKQLKEEVLKVRVNVAIQSVKFNKAKLLFATIMVTLVVTIQISSAPLDISRLPKPSFALLEQIFC